ncbi:pilus assembly protein CpaE [Novosphingobium sp. KACC 22771]|uniref:pilus assembly protein CpaE n=1 Tax=Novosphingobium sp. KACC 22771 TaxID=3025670 RepID=UPI002365CAD4|nr:pilus assembly protein CpaE [Novosphingobium sp. KACC 22771]WDF72002.1 pilus assembly protein CpaE [Novosphingobium sp. KACC 22771]
MNAPWKPGSAPSRDSFAAYVCDDATLDVMRPLAADFGWAPEKCTRGGLRSAVQALSVSSSPAILVVDLSESGDPLGDINALAEVCEPGTVVIAIGQVNDVRLYRDLLGSGINDYLLKPLSAGLMRDALMQAQSMLNAPRAAEAGADTQHLSTAVIGTRGGVGASTVASSIAWLFSADHKQPTALLDLDIHFGTGALALDLEPGRGLSDAIENPSRIDGLFIERAMIRAGEHLSLLSAEAPISHPLLTDGSAFVRLEEEFRHAFEHTVIDLPRNMLINFPHVLADVNVVLLVTELTLAGARDAIRILSWLRANAPHAQVMVVANRVQSGMAEISKADFEASIERKINVVIPFDPKAAIHCAKLGQTFAEANRATKAGAALRDLALSVKSLIAVEAKEGSAPSERKSLLGKIDLMSLLGGKKDGAKEKAR